MKINIIYNNYNTDIDVDKSIKIGILQENILNYCSIIVYNIEYCELIVNNISYILGDINCNFNKTLENVILNNNDKLLKIIIHDRKRDSNGDVIKNNIIIDNYTKWCEENSQNNTRVPMILLLNNIFQISSINELDNDLDNEINNNEPSNINRLIGIFDNYLSLLEPIFINIHEYEDVKIILNDEEFNNIETLIYNNLNNCGMSSCLICTEDFNNNDEIKKTKCNHIFHTNCIKQWLCKESNKCPICRIEIDKKK